MVECVGFKISGFGFRVSGFGFRISGFGFRVLGARFRVSGFRFPILGRRDAPAAVQDPPPSVQVINWEQIKPSRPDFGLGLSHFSGKGHLNVSRWSFFFRQLLKEEGAPYILSPNQHQITHPEPHSTPDQTS